MAGAFNTAVAAQERIAAPQQQADLTRPVRSRPCGAASERGGTTMLYEYVGAMLAVRRTRDLARSALPDAPVESDRTGRATDLLDHLRRVQRKEQEFTQAHQRTRRAHRHAGWVLSSAGIGLLLAVITLATG
jgi:hypothetical protein